MTTEEKIDYVLQLVKEVCEEVVADGSRYSKGTKSYVKVFAPEHFIGKLKELQKVVHSSK